MIRFLRWCTGLPNGPIKFVVSVAFGVVGIAGFGLTTIAPVIAIYMFWAQLPQYDAASSTFMTIIGIAIGILAPYTIGHAMLYDISKALNRRQ